MKPKSDWDDYYPPHLGQSGSLHSVSGDEAARDVVEQLHDVVREVTRKPVDRPPPPGFGFLRQRGFIELWAAKLILYGVIAAVIAATVYGIYYKVMHWCNTACVQVTAERDQLAGTLKAAQERATALALLWAKSVDDAEAKERKRESEAARRYDSLLARAQTVNRGSGLRLSVGTIRLLDDATNEANAARPATVDQEPAETVSGTTDEREIAIAWVKASEAYADAYGKWQACVNFYAALQAAERQP